MTIPHGLMIGDAICRGVSRCDIADYEETERRAREDAIDERAETLADEWTVDRETVREAMCDVSDAELDAFASAFNAPDECEAGRVAMRMVMRHVRYLARAQAEEDAEESAALREMYRRGMSEEDWTR